MALHSRSTPLPDQPLPSSGQQAHSGPGHPIREACLGKPTTYQPSFPHLIRGCPDCGGQIVRSSGCISCTQCGWGKCG